MTNYQIPTKIKKTPDGVEITWEENHLSFFDSRKLRGECPCALCVNEHTGKRIIDVSDIDTDIKPMTIELVGRYAITINWSDGHTTGIYSFEYLKKACTCQKCLESV